MRFVFVRVLGTVAVVGDDGVGVQPPSEPQRKLLALLALRAGRPVASETICDLFDLSSGALRTTVSRLRRSLGAEVLVTESPGYALRCDTDVERFEALIADARTQPAAEAIELRRAATQLFSGPALGEFSDEPWAIAEVARLTELRAGVIEDLVGGLISSGSHDEALAHLHVHIDEFPYRDRPRGQLMGALAQTGRQTEALRAYQEYRTRLINDIGAEPSPELQELDRMIATDEYLAGLSGDGRSGESPALERAVASTAVADPSMTNLPYLPNEFVGRTDELAAVGKALAQARLVTLQGPGGVGKTRLAYRCASDQAELFADGVWVAELVDCTDVSAIMRTISEALRLPAVSSAAECAELLSGHDLLLVLDNCEHIADEVRQVVEPLLAHSARLKLITTSRVRLAITGEHVIRVDPLSDGEAQELFLRRAESAGATLDDGEAEAIAEICARLDGIPLAVELAAATIRYLGSAELADRLDDRFELLKDGPRGSVAGRHESLRTAVDSSYDSLDDETKTFFRRLAVFGRDFPVAAAEAVANDLDASPLQLLSELVDRSLLRSTAGQGRARFTMLETLRQYGNDRLAELGELETAIATQVDWCFTVAEQLAANAFGSSEVASLNELVALSGNLRLAINRLLSAGNARRAGDLVLTVEDLTYAANSLADLVGPVSDAGAIESHPERRRLLAIELTRQSVSNRTDGRGPVAIELVRDIQPDDPGAMQLPALLISTALGEGPGQEFLNRVTERARELPNTAERARLLSAVGLGLFYGAEAPTDFAPIEEAVQAATQAGMKRLAVAAASMACLAGLRQGRPGEGALLARPILADLEELSHPSIMSNGLVAMYTESAIQAELAAGDQVLAIRQAGPNLRGDFNRLGLCLARLVQHHGHDQLAIRAIGACADSHRSVFSARQRERILDAVTDTLTAREIEALLAAGAVSEPTDLYREMWAALAPIMAAGAELG